MALRNQTISDTRTLITETCCNCGVLFALESSYQWERRQDRRNFYCPNGHSQHYTAKSEAELLKEAQAEIARQKRIAANKDEDLRSERASHANTKGQLTRTRKKVERVEKGVCPHCTRHFTNVERHVKTKHPEKVT
jgi:hypothetical protein